MNLGWLVLGGITIWLLWDEIRDARAPGDVEVPVTVLDREDPWDEYVMGLKPGDVIVSPHGVEVELGGGDWTADDIVSLLAEIDRWPEVGAA